MKNIVSTIIVFGSIFILIVAGAFVFDKFNGFGLIDNVDSSLNNGIKKVLESEIDNSTADNSSAQVGNNEKNNYINDNISDNQSDNISEKLEITTIDNISNYDNQSDNNTIDNNTADNNTVDNITIDNESKLKDNKTLDNNTPSDNTSDGMFI